MVAIAINGFTGMAPRYASRLLQDSQASFAANLKATNGNFRGFRGLRAVASLPVNASGWKRAKKFYYPGSDSFVWWTAENTLDDAVDSPLSNDAFNRFYVSSPTHVPWVTTLDSWAAGEPPAALGVPRPTAAPGVSVSGGTGADDTRAYTYVCVTQYGETSAPAPPTIATGKADGTWTINIPAQAPGTIWIDIYRSQPGNITVGNYYRITRLTGASGSYNDTMPADQVTLQLALDTYYNDPPLPGIYGFVTHSSGAIVGFVDRTVAFSKPYLPHAWPEDFRFTVEHAVVGLAVVDNAVVVLTKGHPVIIAGNTPDNVAIINIKDAEPCLSKRSIVVIDNKVYFASSNGLITVSPGGIERPTVDIVTSEEWDDFSPGTLQAVKYNQWYVGFTSPAQGVSISLKPYEMPAIVILDRFDQITGIEVDDRTGEVMIIRTDQVFLFDAEDDNRFAVTWRSKEFITPKPLNFGAFQLVFADPLNPTVENPLEAGALAYNQSRFDWGPLDVLGENLIGGEIIFDPPCPWPDTPELRPPPIAPLGGEPLFDPDVLKAGRQVRFTFIADGVVKYSKLIDDERVHKLPSEYKSTHHFIEIAGSAEVARIVVAETARECRQA